MVSPSSEVYYSKFLTFQFWKSSQINPIIGSESSQILKTNNSFSSQTWAILVPKRNSEVKSIVWPTGPPHVRSQNKGYWQYLIKIKENNGIFTKSGKNLLIFLLNIVFIKLLCYKSLNNCHKYGFKHIWKPNNLNWRNEYQANI